jgi:hypothetical protein
MARSRGVLIGVVASVVITVQNQSSVLAFGWAAIHGAGGALLAFAPAAAAWAVLWFGYVWLMHVRERPAAWLFTVYALGVVALNEVLLPSTPFKDWRKQRFIQSVGVTGLRDEALRSAGGNPLGIRYRFDVAVPRPDKYVIQTSALLPTVADDLHVLLFSPAGIAIEPAPIQFDNVFSTLASDVTYGFAIDLMPAFARLDERTKKPCLVYAEPPGLSQQDFVAALSKHRDVRFRADITVSYEGDTAVAVRDYVTTNGYDVYAMYQAFVSEGHPACQER